jgi:hypothetical protein
MALSVTLHIYSGRHDPVWIFSQDQVREFSERLRFLKDGVLVKARGSEGHLGYRGFTVASVSSAPSLDFGGQKILVNAGVVDPGLMGFSRFDRERELEKWLLSTSGDSIDDEVREEVAGELETASQDAQDLGAVSWLRPIELEDDDVCAPNAIDAPPYEPEKWSDLCTQIYNNCYNYANDRITNSFAQPGASANIYMGAYFSCDEIEHAASADGLRKIKNFNSPLRKGEGWYVALVIKDNRKDYHWYRQDSDGCWSHKIGDFEVSRVDQSGELIINPLTCQRGRYTKFCSFMITNGSVRVK